MQEAWRGGVFYSRPFRRFKPPSAHFKEWSRTFGSPKVGMNHRSARARSATRVSREHPRASRRAGDADTPRGAQLLSPREGVRRLDGQ